MAKKKLTISEMQAMKDKLDEEIQAAQAQQTQQAPPDFMTAMQNMFNQMQASAQQNIQPPQAPPAPDNAYFQKLQQEQAQPLLGTINKREAAIEVFRAYKQVRFVGIMAIPGFLIVALGSVVGLSGAAITATIGSLVMVWPVFRATQQMKKLQLKYNIDPRTR